MKSLFLMIFSLLFLMHPEAYAREGDEKGNGGDVVVCRDVTGQITSVEMLDYFEAKEMRGIRAELPPGTTPEEIATRALARLFVFSPKRANAYMEFIQYFNLETAFREGMEFVDIPDSDHLFFPRGCRVEQLVIQQKVRFPEDRRFFVNSDLWKAMENSQRAGAILHEAVYSEALALGQDDSRRARYFHSRIVENTYKPMRDRDFVELITLVDFPLCELRHFFVACEERKGIPTQALNFDAEGNLSEVLAAGIRLELNHPLVSPLTSPELGNYSEALETATLEPSPLGNVSRLRFRLAAEPIYITVAGQLLALERGSVLTVYPNRSMRFTAVPTDKTPNCFVDKIDGSSHCGLVKLKGDGSLRLD